MAKKSPSIENLIGLLKKNATAGKLDESKQEVNSLIRVLEEHGDEDEDEDIPRVIELPGIDSLLDQNKRIMAILKADRVTIGDIEMHRREDWGDEYS